MKQAPFLTVLALEFFLLALYIRAEYFLWGWSGASHKEIVESKDAVASIARLTWQSGFFFGSLFGLCLMILLLKFANRSVVEPAQSWALVVIPITLFFWVSFIK